MWFIVSSAGTLLHEDLGTSDTSLVSQFVRLSAFFAAGSLIYLQRGRVPANLVLALLSLTAVVGLIVAGRFSAFGSLPVAYLMLYLGSTLPLTRIGARNDISYGLYVWGWPVQPEPNPPVS